MRAFFHRPAPLALVTALTLLTALALVSSREWSEERGRDSAMRTTRGAQRLDAADASPYNYEDAEIVVAEQSDFVASANSSVGLLSVPLIPAVPPSVGRPAPLTVALLVGRARTRLLAQPYRPALGRAPPPA
jgi:hypothetical protein